MQLVDVLPLRILRIEEASSVDMERNSKKLSRSNGFVCNDAVICVAVCSE